MKKIALVLLLVLTLLMVAAGCSEPADNDTVGEQRIISLMPSNTEILFVLGLGDAVVGVTDFCDYPPELEHGIEEGRIQRVGDAFSVNEELMVSMEPTLILLGYENQELVDRLESLGLVTATIVPRNLQESMESIITIGELTGTKEKAEELVAAMEAAFAEVTALTATLEDGVKPRVLMVLDLDFLFVAGSGTLEDELITAAGGINVIQEAGYNSISEEVIIESRPDIILCGFLYKDQILTEKSNWSAIPAVQNETVYDINGDLVNRPTPRLVDGLNLLLELLQPEL